jgi:predicted outer membrane repeat protein
MRPYRVLSVLVGSFLLPGVASAASWTVDASGSGDYETIGEAISAAADGDTISVEPGTYEEAVDLGGKDLTITSTGGSGSTVIDALSNGGNALAIDNGETASISGFTIHNTGSRGIYTSKATVTFDDIVVEDCGTDYSTYGGAVYVNGGTVSFTSSELTNGGGYYGGLVYVASKGVVSFDDSTLSEGTAYYGGGVFVSSGSLTLTDSTVTGNYTYYYGGGLYLAAGTTLTSSGTTYDENGGAYTHGPAIYATTGADVTMTDDTVTGNDADYYYYGYYGAVSIDTGSTLVATRVTFSGNYAYYGAALTVSSYAEATLDQCTFTGNEAYYYGGALAVTGGADAIVTDTTFSDNVGPYGGAIYAGSAFTLEISDSTIEDNESNTGYGGGLYAYYGDLHVADSTFDGNYTSASVGGAVYLQQLYSEAFFERVTFTANEASISSAGAVYGYYYVDALFEDCTFEDNWAAASGGAVYGYYLLGKFTFDGGSMSGNTADAGSGGAVVVYYNADVEATGTTFDSNSAYSDGGAIYAYYTANVEVSDLTFSGNSADHGSGGAIYGYYDIDVNATDVAFSGNSAYTSGGAIFDYYYVNMDLSGTSFDSNVAQKGSGGGVYYDAYSSGAGNFTGADLTFTGNTADVSGGGLVIAAAAEGDLSDTSFESNSTTRNYGGGLYSYYNVDLRVANVNFCGNSAYIGGGAMHYALTGTTDSWTNNVFQENSATYGGGLAGEYVYALSLVNNTFVGNDASGDGGGLYFYYAYVDFRNNLVGYSGDGDGVVADDADTVTYSSWTYNDWYSNASTDASGQLDATDINGSGTLYSDPVLGDWTADGDCSNDDLVPLPASPLIDAGDPTVTDPDGSVSDIGAYGGPGSIVYDGDGDGSYNVHDCNDADATIYPDAIEIPDDGIDQDCDGSDLSGDDLDHDGDGYQTSAVGGPDCDDNDATVNPDATEVWYNGVDEDCDGNDDDQDGDGWDVYTDCDDLDATIYPGAEETYYDGIDQDCAEDDDYDVDGDGYIGEGGGGDDCDDFDEDTHPDAYDAWYDGVDADCDGASDYDKDGDGYDAVAYGGTDCDDEDPDVGECGGIDEGDTGDTDGGGGGDDTGAGQADTGKLGVDTGSGCGCGTPRGSGAAVPIAGLALGLIAARRRRGA